MDPQSQPTSAQDAISPTFLAGMFSQAKTRRTFIAGIFAAVPIAVTVFIVWWIDQKTRGIEDWFRIPKTHQIPFLGVLVALAAIYLTGMITSSIVGKFFLGLLDSILLRLPGVRLLYLGWKQIALTPGGTQGTFSRVVLIPDESGTMRLLGFSSGRVVEADEPCYCVFIPSSPNPITGRLYFIRAERCQFIDMTPEEALKVVLSTGNYVPPLTRIPYPPSPADAHETFFPQFPVGTRR